MPNRSYLSQLWNSLTSPAYYIEVLNQRARRSWRFFFMSFVLLSMLSALIFVTHDLPMWQSKVQSTLTQASVDFPGNVTLNWDKQKLQAEPNQPTLVPYPNSVDKTTLSNLNLPPQLALVDTRVSDVTAALSDASALNPSPFAVVTNSSVFVTDMNGGWSEVSLADVPGFTDNFVVTKANAPAVVQQVQTHADQIWWWLRALSPLYFFVTSFLGALIAALLNSLLISFLLRVFRRPLPYWKIVQIALHVSVAAQLVAICVQRLISFGGVNMYTLTFWAYMIVVLYSMRGMHTIVVAGDPKSS